jgi:hypothetical protein
VRALDVGAGDDDAAPCAVEADEADDGVAAEEAKGAGVVCRAGGFLVRERGAARTFLVKRKTMDDPL